MTKLALVKYKSKKISNEVNMEAAEVIETENSEQCKARNVSSEVVQSVTAECPHCGETDTYTISRYNTYSEETCWNCGGEYFFDLDENNP